MQESVCTGRPETDWVCRMHRCVVRVQEQEVCAGGGLLLAGKVKRPRRREVS